MSTSISNRFSQTTFYDETGNYAGEGQKTEQAVLHIQTKMEI